MQYRKKPVIVSAEQWFPGKDVEGVYCSTIDRYPFVDCVYDLMKAYYVITINNQILYLKSGDWVIEESDGIHHYPCSDDEFKSLYEPV